MSRPDAVDVVDVVVVGAGIAGASAAAEIAETRHVVLVERERQPAHHASGRSASVLSETSGLPIVCALARLSRSFFESPPPGFGEHPLVRPCGLVWVGEDGDTEALDALATRAGSLAPTTRRLTAAETRRLLPTFAPVAVAGGAVHEPDAMAIDTAGTIAGYLRVLRRRGGTVATAAETLELRHERDGTWTVVTTSATWRARAVVNAAGAWADVVADRAGLPGLGLVAMRRTAAITPVADGLVDGWPLVMDVAGRYYCQPEPGGLLVSPADETPVEPCDAQPDELDVALALERVGAASGLPLRAIRHAWAGLRTFAPDRAPVLGEDPLARGFWWLAGQGGAGIKTAPALARLLAGALEGAGFGEDAHELGVTPDGLSPSRLR